ncbi:MAG: hypothetical protein NT120_01855 [Candidatus Aenigmarchaeota archaeon]|nr:hypothetical protein [Candidatus Aenigmarchaeota archaeon]
MELRDEINKRKKENWFEVWFNIEALAIEEDIVKSAMKKHIEKFTHVKNVFAYEVTFSDITKVEKPIKNVEEAYSQVVKAKFFVKDLRTLLNVVLTYGPSSIELIGPHKKEIDIGEVQDIANVLAGLVHQFAAAGAGGIVITPEEKK